MRPSKLLLPSLLLLGATPLAAVTLTVDTTSDAALSACTGAPGDCSLRGALGQLTTSVPHDVHFDIPMSDPGCVPATGVCTIRASTDLPPINPNANGIIVIDGYTQPGAVANTLTPDQGGTNAQLKIVLSGNAPSISNAINFVRHGTVRGLVINGFRDNTGGGTAVAFSLNGAGGVVEGCFLGTDVTGTVAVPNGYAVIFNSNPFGGNSSADGRIGGLLPAQRNLISGNRNESIILAGFNHSVIGNLIGTTAAGTAALGNGTGISCAGSNTGFSCLIGGTVPGARNVVSGNGFGIRLGGTGPHNGTRIRGNFIGTDASGTLPVGNTAVGIELGQPGNGVAMVGGSAAGEGNVIAFNGTQGVAARSTRGHVSGNRMFRNGQLGISLTTGDNGSAAGRLPNDPGDGDGTQQNFPEISAYATNGSNVDLSYRVDSTTANSAYPLRIELFKADGDEGRDFIGADTYDSTEAQTVQAINLAIPPGVTVGANDTIVGTATDANGNTSEFSFTTASLAVLSVAGSACVTADSVFCNGFEIGAQVSLQVRVRSVAASGPFAPNGVVTVSDNRGASCSLTLSPTATALTSEGACTLVNSGTPGPITITATLNTAGSAFASSTGTNVTATANLTVQ